MTLHDQVHNLIADQAMTKREIADALGLNFHQVCCALRFLRKHQRAYIHSWQHYRDRRPCPRYRAGTGVDAVMEEKTERPRRYYIPLVEQPRDAVGVRVASVWEWAGWREAA